MFMPPVPNGQLVTITPSDPAAGVDFNWGVPGNSIVLIRSVRFFFLTDGTAANRLVQLACNDTANVFGIVNPGTLQTAAQNVEYNWAIGITPTTATPGGGTRIQVNAPLPEDLYLRGQGGTSDLLQSFVRNIQAGDQISSIVIRYEQWTIGRIT
jgi:hypothetical protein